MGGFIVMKIRKSVKRAMHLLQIEKLRRNQLKPINEILDGHDTMVIAPTSFGKSLLYLIPALTLDTGITIVIEPLLALIHDQVYRLRKLDISASYLDSTQSKSEQSTVMDDLRKCRVKILYVAPERLETGILSWIEEYSQIKIIVVDECHCVVSWGDTFRDAYRSIGEYIDSLKHRPVIVALSATAIPEDRPRIMKLLSMRSAKEFAVSLYRSNLSLMKKNVPSGYGHLSELKKCLKKYHRHTTIVFCNTKAATENVAKELKKIYRSEVMAYHSRCKEQEQDMLSGKKHIIVATSALSMGVDIRNVDLIIHYNMPISLADYYQMAGRAGREGQHGRSILLYDPDDYTENYWLLRQIDDKKASDRALKRLDEMKEFCEDEEQCMAITLLNALGDSRKNACRYCTNCQKGR